MNIDVIGAEENNLKHLDISLPRNELIVFTGVSGSGKSSLVFDTIYAAAQAELLETLSTYARQSMPRITSPRVERITGLSPAVAIQQRPLSKSPRSTVGTATDIYSFVRLLFSRIGLPILSASDFSFNTPSGACEVCSGLGMALQINRDALIDWNLSLNQGAIRHRTWKVGSRYWNIIKAVGLFDMDKPISRYSVKELASLLTQPPYQYQNKVPGFVQSFSYEGIASRILKRATDSRGGKEYDEQFLLEGPCEACGGSRLNARARQVKVGEKRIVDLLSLDLVRFRVFLEQLEGEIARTIAEPTIKRLRQLEEVGLGYLSLNRSTDTLSGGEAQRIKLARQLGSVFTEMIYVLDEPTQGLHSSDVDMIAKLLRQLAAHENSVLVVEHDRSIMKIADLIVELGPGAGKRGGEIVGIASPSAFAQLNTPTGQLLADHEFVPVPRRRRALKRSIRIENAHLHNLADIDVLFYWGVLNCVTGVSGSGKSSLVSEFMRTNPDAVLIDQGGVGSSSRSIVATYVGAFDGIRSEFARETGRDPALFAFNSDGACPQCQGLGFIPFEMHFLGDIRQFCDACAGKRYSEEALKYRYRGRNISEVLHLTIEEAVNVFERPDVRERLGLLNDVGLGYLEVGQALGELSGGERQRLKIAEKLSSKGHIYILDEPTRGLHAADVAVLLQVLNRLIESGNTLVVVEHDLDVIKTADWIVDLGPGGGSVGGKVVASGTPEQVAAVSKSLTGAALRPKLRPE